MINRILNIGEEFYHLDMGISFLEGSDGDIGTFREIKKRKVAGINFTKDNHYYIYEMEAQNWNGPGTYTTNVKIDESMCYETFEECKKAYVDRMKKSVEILAKAVEMISNASEEVYKTTLFNDLFQIGHPKNEEE